MGSSTSITFPTRRSVTSSNPRPKSARFTAAPWTSRIPGFSLTRTRTFILRGSARAASGMRALDQAAVDFLVGSRDAAEDAPEAVLVELLPRRPVPEPARVGRDLVAQVELLPRPPELELEVHEEEPARPHVRPQDGVDPERRAPHPGELRRRREREHADMVVVQHRVAERAGLVVDLAVRLRVRRPLLEPRPFGELPGHDLRTVR